MKRTVVCIAGALLAVGLVILAWVPLLNSLNAWRQRAIAVNIMTLDGHRLTTLFDGFRPASFGLKEALKSQTRARAAFQCTATTKQHWLRHLAAFFERRVHAQAPLPPCADAPAGGLGPCTSQCAVTAQWSCEGGAPHCPRNYTVAWSDCNENPDKSVGFQMTSIEGCDRPPTQYPDVRCRCNLQTCRNSFRCYNNDDCAEGQFCQTMTGECVAAPCTMLYWCHWDSECISPETCQSGCCTPPPCTRNDDCPWGWWCAPGGQCAQAMCAPGNECHVAGDCQDNKPCVAGCCDYTYTPILIDVEGDGYSMTSAEAGVIFDITATNKPFKISWTAAGSDDAWLAIDRNGNGRIDDGAEVFSNFAPQADNGMAPNGFNALAAYDVPSNGGNGDGAISSADRVYSGLLLWQDLNHNGVSEREELHGLAQIGISTISLKYKETKWMDAFGNWFRYRAAVVREGVQPGRDRWAYDVVLLSTQ